MPLPVFKPGKWKKAIHITPHQPIHRPDRISALRMISIIIPAHNEQNYLLATLEALKRQNYPCYEVIVVANGCSDDTANVADGMCDRLLVLSQKSLGVARNLGARMAKGELLVFLDADTVPEPLALRVIAEQFTRSYSAGTIKGRPDSMALRYRLTYAIKNFFHRYSLHRGSSGVICCWKEQFLHIGGFDEGLEVRENSELIWRLKRFGSYKYIGDVSAVTSMRRYEQRGFARMFWLWVKLWFQTHFGDLHRRTYDAIR
jgi:glycosyltransferase involved in cell wall biosynthesis